jgi:hypothetical protein
LYLRKTFKDKSTFKDVKNASIVPTQQVLIATASRPSTTTTTTTSNKQQLPIATMKKGVPQAPRKASQGPFKFQEKLEVVTNASDAPLRFIIEGVWFRNICHNVVKKANPKTFLQRLVAAKEGDKAEMRSSLNAVTQPDIQRVTAALPASASSYILKDLSAEVRCMIYNYYFKGTTQVRNESPALVVAMRCSREYYQEVVECYYRGCNLVISQYNLDYFIDKFPAHRVRWMGSLTLEKE